MSTHPRVTVEGLDPYMWIAARWMGIDSETAREAAERYDNGDRCEDTEFGLVHGDGGEATYLNDGD